VKSASPIRKRAQDRREMTENLASLGQPDYSFATVARFRPNPAYEAKHFGDQPDERPHRHGRQRNRNDLRHHERRRRADDLPLDGGTDANRIMLIPSLPSAAMAHRRIRPGMPHPRKLRNERAVLANTCATHGVLTWEDAIRRMTSLPARTFSFRDRGLVPEGMAADLVVFDPARVEDKATFAKPHHIFARFSISCWSTVNNG